MLYILILEIGNQPPNSLLFFLSNRILVGAVSSQTSLELDEASGLSLCESDIYHFQDDFLRPGSANCVLFIATSFNLDMVITPERDTFNDGREKNMNETWVFDYSVYQSCLICWRPILYCFGERNKL